MLHKLSIFCLILLGFSFQSCDNITEEIYLNEDGSGTYKLYSDMVPMVTNMSTKMALMLDSTATPPTAEEIEERLDKQLWADLNGKVLDSIMDFSQNVPDSLKSRPDVMKFAESTEGFMYGSKELGYMHTGMRMKFDGPADLTEKVATMIELQNANGGGMLPGMENMIAPTTFTYKNGIFKKSTVIEKALEVPEEQKPMFEMMIGEGAWTTIIHLPRIAKKVKGNNLLKNDGETVTYEYKILDVVTGNQNTDVKLEMKK